MEQERKMLDPLADFEAEAARFARELISEKDGATLVTLSGDLGAGKTTFVQNVARTLGVTEPVTSPTFVLAKSYVLPEDGTFSKLVHIDAYRLTEGKDLAALDLDHVMKDLETLVMLEWPERVADALPVPAAAISLEALPDGARTITYA